MIRNPSAERWSDHGRGNDRHAIKRESRRPLVRRKRIHQNRLLNRSEPASSNALQHAKENQQSKRRR
jgi:hypothetical protein